MKNVVGIYTLVECLIVARSRGIDKCSGFSALADVCGEVEMAEIVGRYIYLICF